MKNSMMEAGVYSIEDIEKICRLESEYAQECEKIADQCAAEGYPPYGSNYELRCENARRYYNEQIALIDSSYDLYEDEEASLVISASDLKEARAEKDIRDAAAPKNEQQKQKSQEHEIG